MAGSQTDIAQNQIEKLEDRPQEASLRDVSQNPEEYEGDQVIVTGQAAFDGSSIQDGGYKVSLRCEGYSYEWGTFEETKIYGTVEYIPGEIDLRIRCYKAPQRIE